MPVLACRPLQKQVVGQTGTGSWTLLTTELDEEVSEALHEEETAYEKGT